MRATSTCLEGAAVVGREGRGGLGKLPGGGGRGEGQVSQRGDR